MDGFLFALIGILAMLISLSVHEYCHALAGYLLGDETAKRMGRLTLNPAAHIDPIGTVLVPILGALSGFPLIGWAKPVPFNPHNLKYRKWGAVIVALAGPASNFLSAAIYLIGLKLAVEAMGLPPRNLLVIFLLILVIINVVLGIFNFIPVPPLDGSKLLTALLDSPKYRNARLFLETQGPSILFLIIILDFLSPVSILGRVFDAAINFAFSLAGLERLPMLF